MENIEITTAMIVYFSIGCFALLLVVISFLIGEIGGFFHDVTSPMTDWLGNHLPFAGDHSIEFSRVLNSGSMLGFLAGFGFVAALAMAQWRISPLAAGGWGVLGGLAMGALLGTIYLGLTKSHATTSYDVHDLIGTSGLVTEVIPRGSAGRIECNLRGSKVWHTARAATEEDIPVGTPVRVEGVIGDAIMVTKTQTPSDSNQA